MKRYLTQREADRCENAREPVCKCRCGGAKHGAKRVSGDFSALPMDDPHYRPSLSRQQVMRLLNRAETYVIGNLCAFGTDDNAWRAWREARNIITKAKKACW